MPSEEHRCVERARHLLRAYAMLEPGDRVLVAVSGGPDSVCLLHVLRELGFPLEVAHFDHQTRNGESGKDADFVRRMAAGLDIPFYFESRPVAEEATAQSRSFEEYAREVRYDFLVRTAEKRHCAAIATGHHADDQVETVLIRLIRGTTPRGLAGIPAVSMRTTPSGGQCRIIRPLLDCTREMVLEYLETRGIKHRTDHTNSDTVYLRNRVRHGLLPLLEKHYNPGVRNALLRLAESQRCDNDLLDALLDAAIGDCIAIDGQSGLPTVDRPAFAAAPRALQRRLVARLAERNSIACSFERIEAAVDFIVGGPTGNRFDLGAGISLQNGRVTTAVLGASTDSEESSMPLRVPGTTPAFGKLFTITYHDAIPGGDPAQYCNANRQVFDADRLGEHLAIRHRRPGDRFRPLGMTGSKKLQDYLCEIALPVWLRDTHLLLVADERIAWVVGHAINAEFAITPDTRRVLEVDITDAP